MANQTKVIKLWSANTGSANTFSWSGGFEVFKSIEVEVYLDDISLTYAPTSINEGASPRQYSVDVAAKTIHIGGADLTSGTIKLQANTDVSNARAVYQGGSSVASGDLNANQDQLLRKLSEKDVSSDTSFTTGATAPTSPADGDIWYDSVDGRAYVYYVDIDSGQWVEASPPFDSDGDRTFTQLGTGAVARTWDSKLQDIISVKDYGAVGDGTTDDTTAIDAAFQHVVTNGGTLYFPEGTYKVTSSITNNAVSGTQSIKLIGEGAKISFDQSGYLSYGFYIHNTGATAPKSIIFDGLRIQCNNKVATGIRVSISTSSGDYGFVGVYRCRIFNCFQDDTISTSAIGILVDGAETAEIISNKVSGVNRDNATTSGVCAGISVTDSTNSLVSNNYIYNIRHGGVNLKDADGIKVFDTNTSEFYARGKHTVSENYIEDCEGRFIKLQVGGHAHVVGNYCRLLGSLTLIENWKGLDAQTGFSLIEGNKLEIQDNWSGGASANLFSLQAITEENTISGGTTDTWANEGAQHLCINNIVNCQKTIKYGWMIGTPDADSTAHTYIGIKNNLVQGVYKSTGSSGGSSAITEFIYSDARNWDDLGDIQGSFTWDITGNTVEAYDWIDLNGTNNNPDDSPGTPRDYSDVWIYIFCDNTKTPEDVSRNLWNSTDSYTSNIKIAGNTGGAGNVYSTFDFAKLMPGCSFRNGSGSRTNGPANYAWYTVSTPGSALWKVEDKDQAYWSDDGTTWTADINSA